MARRNSKIVTSISKSARLDLPAVLFDLDGTLIDSNYQHVAAWSQVLRSAGVVIPTWKIHRRIGMSGKSFLKELLRELPTRRRKLDLDQLERRHDVIFLRAVSQLSPLPGTVDLIQHLSANRVRMAVATTGSREQSSQLWRRLNIHLDVQFVTGDDVERAKPSPDIFLAAADRLQSSMSDCIVIGDSVWDMLAAGRKSALAVGLLSGGYGQEDLERAGAFRVYSDPADVLMHLEQLGLPGLHSTYKRAI